MLSSAQPTPSQPLAPGFPDLLLGPQTISLKYQYGGPVPGSSESNLHLECFVAPWVPNLGFPGGSMVNNPPANAGDAGDAGLIPGSGRSPGEGNGYPLQYSCLENSMDRGA